MNAEWQRHGRKSLDIYKSIQAQFDISVRQNGSVYIASDAEEMTLLEELAAINRANDYPAAAHLRGSVCSVMRVCGQIIAVAPCFSGGNHPRTPRGAVPDIAVFSGTKRAGLFSKTLAIEVEQTGDGCPRDGERQTVFLRRSGVGVQWLRVSIAVSRCVRSK